GLSWTQLGLGAGSLLRGLRWGGACAAIVVAGYAGALAAPALHPVFLDPRARRGLRPAFGAAFLSVPLGTVVFEEVAFRGVLWALVEEKAGASRATAATAALF